MLVILDWDGTLCDSIAKITRCMQCAAKDLGMDLPLSSAVRNIVGLGLPEAVKSLFPHLSPEDLKRLQAAYVSHFVDHDQTPSPFFEGVEDCLIRMKDAGHQLAVATGKSRKGLDRVFENIGWSDFFHASRCADETASKPDPKMLYEIVAEFGASPGDAVMVGDTEYDMEMARRAKMPRIGVSYGAHSAERLAAYNLEQCLDVFPQLEGWVSTRSA